VGQTTPDADVETPPPPPPLAVVVVVVRGAVVVRLVVDDGEDREVDVLEVDDEDDVDEEDLCVVVPEVGFAAADVGAVSAVDVPDAGAVEAAPAPRTPGVETGVVVWLLQPARAVAQTNVHATTRAAVPDVVP
jgi:hypothetical protein